MEIFRGGRHACRLAIVAVGLGAAMHGASGQEAPLRQVLAERMPAIDFARLPLRDAIVSTRGSGARKLVVFADPDCPYCRQLESTLQGAQNLTVYVFLMPILGPGSLDKARAIWCAKDQDAAWRDWMLQGKAPNAAPLDCDTGALDRNLALGRQHAIRGTPELVFEDGTRIGGALSAVQLERRLTPRP